MRIEQIIEQIGQLKVAVIGDVMIDRYIEGKIERISPEAPVPVLNFESEENRLGGAANVALNLQSMGAEVFICSVIGDDDNGEELLKILSKRNFSTNHIIKSTERQTTVKTRVIAANQHILRVDREDTEDLNNTETSKLLDVVISLIRNNKIDIILLQDYNKGVLTNNVIENTLKIARTNNIITAVDPKKKNFLTFENVNLFKPNLSEVRSQLPFEIKPTIEDLDKADSYLRSKLSHKISLITLSEHGVYLSDGENSMICPTQVRSIVDVCGAGDTVISVASLVLSLENDLSNLGFIANLAGGQVCEKVGVVPIDKNLLVEEYNTNKQTYLREI
jgi:rfaE bifunctional protein kinase chain/domain